MCVSMCVSLCVCGSWQYRGVGAWLFHCPLHRRLALPLRCRRRGSSLIICTVPSAGQASAAPPPRLARGLRPPHGHTYAISQPYFVDSAIDRSYLPDKGQHRLQSDSATVDAENAGGRSDGTTTSSCWLVEAERAARSRSPAPVTPAQSRTNNAPTKPPKRPAAAHVLVAARGALAARRRCRG
eukprot:COSAG06_NODE_116_length_23262_cov_47.854034_3_plen_183_part_00